MITRYTQMRGEKFEKIFEIPKYKIPFDEENIEKGEVMGLIGDCLSLGVVVGFLV